mgnify:CR=1 FL=1
MNKITLIGNLTNEPEKRATPNGTSVTTFTIAVNRRGQDKPDFFRINAWRGLADTCSKFLAKGRKVAVVGELQARTYEAKDGKTKVSLDVQADEVEFLSPAEHKQEKPKTDEWQDISSKDLPWGD